MDFHDFTGRIDFQRNLKRTPVGGQEGRAHVGVHTSYSSKKDLSVRLENLKIYDLWMNSLPLSIHCL